MQRTENKKNSDCGVDNMMKGVIAVRMYMRYGEGMKLVGSTKWEQSQQFCNKKEDESKGKLDPLRLYGIQHDELAPGTFGVTG